MPYFNHQFWAGYFRQAFIPQLATIVDALVARLLPQFDDIEAEAEGLLPSDNAFSTSALVAGLEDQERKYRCRDDVPNGKGQRAWG
jgi:hypothetical protein